MVAALLHDAIEDQEVPHDLIVREFGSKVGAIVAEVDLFPECSYILLSWYNFGVFSYSQFATDVPNCVRAQCLSRGWCTSELKMECQGDFGCRGPIATKLTQDCIQRICVDVRKR